MPQTVDSGSRRPPARLDRLDPLTRSSPSLGGNSSFDEHFERTQNPLLSNPRIGKKKSSALVRSRSTGNKNVLLGGSSSSSARVEFEELSGQLNHTVNKMEENKRRQQELLADRLQQNRVLTHEIKPPMGIPPLGPKKPSAPSKEAGSSSPAGMKFKHEQDPAKNLLGWMNNIIQGKPTSVRYLTPLAEGPLQSGSMRKRKIQNSGRERRGRNEPVEEEAVDEEAMEAAERNALAEDALADYEGFQGNPSEIISSSHITEGEGEWLQLSPPKEGWKPEHLSILQPEEKEEVLDSPARKKSPKGKKDAEVEDEAHGEEDVLLSQPSVEETQAQEMEIPSVQARALCVFRRLQMDGEISVQQLNMAILCLGHPSPKDDIIRDIVNNDFKGQSELAREEFYEFVDLYEKGYYTYMQSMFDVQDKDGSGYLSLAEVTSVLRSLNISPVLNVVKELVREVTGSSNSQSRVELEHFIAIMDIIRDRAGFTKSETATFTKVFKQYDRDNDKHLNCTEMKLALKWMGFVTNDGIAQALFDCADRDKSGFVEFQEFMILMRMHREREVDLCMRVFCEMDEENGEHDGKIKRTDVSDIFTKLGYVAARPHVIEECLTKTNNDKDELVFEDLYVLLDCFRMAERFTDAERDEINEVYNRFDALDSGCVGGIQLGAAINWLGYPSTMEQVQEILEEFDLDENGSLDNTEFLKLIRHFKVMLVTTAREAFELGDEDNSGTLDGKELRPVLLTLGFAPDIKEVDEIIKTKCGDDGLVDFWELVGLVESFRIEEGKRLRANEGFANADMRKLKRRFNRYDMAEGEGRKLSGTVKNKQLAALLEEILPGVRENIETHKKAKAVLEKGDLDKDGIIDFQDFLRMMRAIQDEADATEFARELRVAVECKFKRSEVKEFRKIFKMFDNDTSGQISYDELYQLFEGLVPLGAEATKDLKQVLASVDSDGDRALDFAEFLIIMRKLQDKNWAGINEASEEVARQVLAEEAEKDHAAELDKKGEVELDASRAIASSFEEAPSEEGRSLTHCNSSQAPMD